MSIQETLEDILAELTPEHLRSTVLSIAATQASDNRSAVSLSDLMDALTKGRDLGTGAEGWAAFLKLKKAISNTVLSIPQMRFIEGDS